MTMRERFTDNEWREIRHIPFDGFLMVALADQKLEKEEVAAFVETLARAAALKDPLHREIALDLTGQGESVIGDEMTFEAEETGQEMNARITRTKAVLRDKLTKGEYESFLGSVLMNAIAVAAATGKHRLFGKKSKKPISDEETRALAAFCAVWDIDPEAALKRYAAA